MTIVLCSKGYPGKYKKNIRINNLNNLKLKKIVLFFMLVLNFSKIRFIQLVEGFSILHLSEIIF